MWHKAIWKGHSMRLELTRVGLLVEFANHYTTRGAQNEERSGYIHLPAPAGLLWATKFKAHFTNFEFHTQLSKNGRMLSYGCPWYPVHLNSNSLNLQCITRFKFHVFRSCDSKRNLLDHKTLPFVETKLNLVFWPGLCDLCYLIFTKNFITHILGQILVVAGVLLHINLCRLFNAKYIFIQIISSISNNSVLTWVHSLTKHFYFKLFSLVKQF